MAVVRIMKDERFDQTTQFKMRYIGIDAFLLNSKLLPQQFKQLFRMAFGFHLSNPM